MLRTGGRPEKKVPHPNGWMRETDGQFHLHHLTTTPSENVSVKKSDPMTRSNLASQPVPIIGTALFVACMTCGLMAA